MKKILGLLILINISGYAQCIVPLEDFWTIGGEYIEENDCYAKDVNNTLGKYVGIWKGTNDGKSYEFRIVKKVDNKQVSEFKVDIVTVKYIIKDANGTILEDTTSLYDEDNLVIWGMYPAEYNDSYLLYYIGENSDCGQSGTVFIHSTGNGNTTLVLVPDREFIDPDNCVGRVGQILPTVRMTLTKQ